MFSGGIDTSAVTMVDEELAKRPDLMKNAQDELRSCFRNKGKTLINEADIDELRYLKMTIKETLRLHPPAVLAVPRETVSHFKIDGNNIHPKTMLIVNVWAIGREHKCWKDPEEFIPERFLDSPIDYKGQHFFELLPFGSGRRMCPAVYMGASTAELGLPNMLYGVDWKLPDGMKEEELDVEESVGAKHNYNKKDCSQTCPN